MLAANTDPGSPNTHGLCGTGPRGCFIASPQRVAVLYRESLAKQNTAHLRHPPGNLIPSKPDKPRAAHLYHPGRTIPRARRSLLNATFRSSPRDKRCHTD